MNGATSNQLHDGEHSSSKDMLSSKQPIPTDCLSKYTLHASKFSLSDDHHATSYITFQSMWNNNNTGTVSHQDNKSADVFCYNANELPHSASMINQPISGYIRFEVVGASRAAHETVISEVCRVFTKRVTGLQVKLSTGKGALDDVLVGKTLCQTRGPVLLVGMASLVNTVLRPDIVIVVNVDSENNVPNTPTFSSNHKLTAITQAICGHMKTDSRSVWLRRIKLRALWDESQSQMESVYTIKDKKRQLIPLCRIHYDWINIQQGQLFDVTQLFEEYLIP